MKQLHIKLDENSPAIRCADAQADKVGARGHVSTHLDCYTKVPEKSEYNIKAMVLDCQYGMPQLEDVKSLTTLEDMALLLHTANLEKNEYGTDMYFATETFLSEKVLYSILEKKPLFIIIDSHGIAEKGKKYIDFDKICEANGCHVIENADFSCLGEEKNIQLKILINLDHRSSGKPCEIYLNGV
ncbi:hypothetical protein [uncultured Bacteroides sp.]|uniref:hypothetical protein n=1 Tax=uncultured Bacteroides sp. TaxID=162156 RepID=UPI002601E5B7|nr:hypothetical protein [uncultured Bacteroides sp.]